MQTKLQQQQRVRNDVRNRTQSIGHSQATLCLDPIIPSDVTLAEVLGLVEVLGEKGFNIPISVGGQSRFFRGSSGFLSLLATAKILGLVSIADNRLVLTDIGLDFLKSDFSEQMEVLRAKLTRIEPFKSAVELLSDKKSVNEAAVSRKLSEKYAVRDFDPNLIRLVLIEWGLSTCLFEYSNEGDFRLP